MSGRESVMSSVNKTMAVTTLHRDPVQCLKDAVDECRASGYEPVSCSVFKSAPGSGQPWTAHVVAGDSYKPAAPPPNPSNRG